MPSTILDDLPPEHVGDRLEERVRAAVLASRRKVVALDDDPTGVQTVHDTAVLTTWETPDLATELRRSHPVFFLLTNSRSLPTAEAAALNRTIASRLQEAEALARAVEPDATAGFVLASRSDSTLRGHYPAETDALTEVLGAVDGVLLVPAFFEGGRYTINDMHYVRDGEHLVPAAETEFAKDATFGYTHSDLRHWVEEKTGGRIPAADVGSLSIATIREGGPEQVAAQLMEVSRGQPVVVNAASYADLNVVVLGLLRAEAAGKRFIYRIGASFVRARAGLPARPLLTRADLLGSNASPALPGLVVVGSHVRRSGEQLMRCLELPGVVGIELNVPEVLGDGMTGDREVERVGAAAADALRSGRTPVVYTSRRVEQASEGDQLVISRRVSAALVAIVQRLEERPGFVIGKGGITSSDVGTQGLGARRAVVLGQIRPGVPVWRLGPETRFPGLPYVVFPGNVGDPETLAEVVTLLWGRAFSGGRL